MRTGENIRERKDGRFEARYIKGRDENGKLIYGYCYGKTYEEAKAKRDEKTKSQNALKEMNLLILGAGEHGQEVKELAQSLRIFNKIGFLDDDPKKEVLGPCSNFAKYQNEYSIAIPAVGNEELRIKWMEGLVNTGYIIPTLIHPSAVVSPNAKIGAGTVICAGATVGMGAELGIGCIIDSGAAVGRNAKLSDYTWLATGETAK